MNPINLGHDWQDLQTLSSFNKDWPDFKFKGVGWYLSPTDTMLVTSAGMGPISGKLPEKEEYYYFTVWNQPDVRETVRETLRPFFDDTKVFKDE